MKGRKHRKQSRRFSQNGSYHCSADGATKYIPNYVKDYEKKLVFFPEIKIEALDRSDITGTFKCLIDEYSEKGDDRNMDH